MRGGPVAAAPIAGHNRHSGTYTHLVGDLTATGSARQGWRVDITGAETRAGLRAPDQPRTNQRGVLARHACARRAQARQCRARATTVARARTAIASTESAQAMDGTCACLCARPHVAAHRRRRIGACPGLDPVHARRGSSITSCRALIPAAAPARRSTIQHRPVPRRDRTALSHTASVRGAASSQLIRSFTLGAALFHAERKHGGLLPTVYVLVVRFLVMPAITIPLVWSIARAWPHIREDRLQLFIAGLAPSGPPALLVYSLVTLAGHSEGEVAFHLVIAYAALGVIRLTSAATRSRLCSRCLASPRSR